MNNLRAFVNEKLMGLLEVYFPAYSEIFFDLAVIGWIVFSAILLHFAFKRIVFRVLKSFHLEGRSFSWLNALNDSRLFHNIVLIAQSAIIQFQAKAWLLETSNIRKII